MVLAALRRIVSGVVVVLLVVATTWSLVRWLRPGLFPPGEPWLTGLRDYFDRALLHGDLGTTRIYSVTVMDFVREGVPIDVVVLAGGVAFGLLLGVAAGAACAARPRSLPARGGELLALVAQGTPVFVVGLSLLLLLGPGIAQVDLGFTVPDRYVAFSASPARWLGALIAPWTVLGLPLAGLFLRSVRGMTLEVLEADYVRTARAKGGSPRRVLLVHAVPTALAPTLNLSGAVLNLTLLNLVLVERVFNIPGLFSRLLPALAGGNFDVLYALAGAGAAYIVTANLLIDATMHLLDPRVRRAGATTR